MLVEAFKGGSLPESRVTEAESVPSLADLAKVGKVGKGAGA